MLVKQTCRGQHQATVNSEMRTNGPNRGCKDTPPDDTDKVRLPQAPDASILEMLVEPRPDTLRSHARYVVRNCCSTRDSA